LIAQLPAGEGLGSRVIVFSHRLTPYATAVRPPRFLQSKVTV
jgi:hypothetical protein